MGCSKKNQVDLEYLMGSVENEGFSITNIPEESDAIVINTCGFIEPAVTEAIETILEMHERKKDGAKLIVTGCMSQRFSKELKDEIPEIDFMTGVGELEKVVQYLRGDQSLWLTTGIQGSLPMHTIMHILKCPKGAITDAVIVQYPA